MKILPQLLIAVILATSTTSVITAEPIITNLTIEGQVAVTTSNGILLLKRIIDLTPGKQITIKLVNGRTFNGVVKRTESFADEYIKIFGEITDEPNAGFGFGFRKDGTFAGAIILGDKKELYTAEFSEVANGFIFIRNYKTKDNNSI